MVKEALVFDPSLRKTKLQRLIEGCYYGHF
jgi:hypothetical protein